MAPTTERRYELEPWRQPTIQAEDTLIFSEPGRILPDGGNHNIDYRSHWFCVTKRQYAGFNLLVKHGGGEERISLTSYNTNLIETLRGLDSDSRYRMLHTFFDLYHAGQAHGTDETAKRYRTAFANGTLKKRKVRGGSGVKIWFATIPTEESHP